MSESLSYQEIDKVIELTGVDISDPHTKKGERIGATDWYLRHVRGDKDLPDFDTFYRTPRLGDPDDQLGSRPVDPTRPLPAKNAASSASKKSARSATRTR